MKMRIKFFEDNFTEAIKAGVYEIYLQVNGKEELLYIGESVFVLVRCATHLYEIAKGNGYLGFTEKHIENENITLVFKLEQSITDKEKRKKTEKALIAEKKPTMQSGISDRVKTIESMINKLTELITE